MSAWTPVRSTRAAFAFLTRLPVGGFPYGDDEWRWAAAYFPLVGAALGGVAALVARALSPLGDVSAALGAIAVLLLATGALHEDGFADTSDALGGAFDRDKILTILKDSRVGTFGACAVVISIAGRAALLARLGSDAAWALPLVGAVARLGPVWQIAWLPYVSSGASRSRPITRAGTSQACVATVWAVGVGAAIAGAGAFSPARIAAVFGAVGLLTWITGARYARRLGGITGDFLGATEQLAELTAYAVLAWASR